MFEVELYQTKHILIFRRPTPEDFRVYRTVKCKTKQQWEGVVKGENGSMECVDAPYQPIRVYRIRKGKRELVWQQGWDNCWGDPVVHPKGSA